MFQYQHSPVSARCPYCHATSGKLLFTVGAEEAATHFVRPWSDPQRHAALKEVIDGIWDGAPCQVIECDSCHGGFAFPFLGGDAAFYEIANQQQGPGSYPTNRWEYGESLRQCGHIESAIEIGAGDGAFMGRLLQHGADHATAVEYSPYGLQAIRTKCPGVTVRHGDELATIDRTFSHAFMFQSLEHIGNIDIFMETLSRLVTGQAFISVPNPERTAFGEQSGLTLDMPPNHIGRYSRLAMASLVRRHGFEVRSMTDEPLVWKEAFPEYLRYRFLRLGQIQGSLPAWIDAHWQGKKRKLAAAAFSLILAPQAVFRLAASPRCGLTRLFVLQKAAP